MLQLTIDQVGLVLETLPTDAVLRLRSLSSTLNAAAMGPWLVSQAESYFAAVRAAHARCPVPHVVPACYAEKSAAVRSAAFVCTALYGDAGPPHAEALVRSVLPGGGDVPVQAAVWPWGSVMAEPIERWLTTATVPALPSPIHVETLEREEDDAHGTAEAALPNVGILLVSPKDAAELGRRRVQEAWRGGSDIQWFEADASATSDDTAHFVRRAGCFRVSMTDAARVISVIALRQRTSFPPLDAERLVYTEPLPFGDLTDSVRDLTMLGGCATKVHDLPQSIWLCLPWRVRETHALASAPVVDHCSTAPYEFGALRLAGVERVTTSFNDVELTSLTFSDELGRDTAHCRHIDSSFLCKSLTSLDLHKTTVDTRITNGSFRGCVALPNLQLPASLSLLVWSFGDCRLLRSLDLRHCRGLKKLFSSFNGCSSLVEVWLPETSHLIVRSSFTTCASLKRIHFPDNDDESVEGICIANGSFNFCPALKELVIPASVWTVSRSFEHCRQLKVVDMGGAVNLATLRGNFIKSTPRDVIWPVLSSRLRLISGGAFSSTHGAMSSLTLHLPDDCRLANAFNEMPMLETLDVKCGSICCCFNRPELLKTVVLRPSVRTVEGSFNRATRLQQVTFEEADGVGLHTVSSSFHLACALQPMALPSTLRSVSQSFRWTKFAREAVVSSLSTNVDVDKASFLVAAAGSPKPKRLYSRWNGW